MSDIDLMLAGRGGGGGGGGLVSKWVCKKLMPMRQFLLGSRPL